MSAVIKFEKNSSVPHTMELRAVCMIVFFFMYRLFALFGLHIVHEHNVRNRDSDVDMC